MKTVLFVWELGEGLGHAAPLAAIARSLQARAEPLGGIRPVFAFRDPVFTRRIFGGEDWPVLPAPQFTGDLEAASYAASYAQLLAAIGFARWSDLQAIVAAWDDLYRLVEPDLIIADHSPTACFAARGRIPVLAIGSGFTLPPSEFPEYPALRRDMQPPAIQSRILDIANRLLKARNVAPLKHLPQLLQGDARAVFGLPHLDPYGPFRHDRLLGPYEPGAMADPIAQDAGVFYYGHSRLPVTDTVVEGLVAARLPIHAFVNGPPSAASELLRQHAKVFHDRPPELAQVFGQCSVIVSHGGAGLTQAALAAGRPQVILPIHVESQINGLRIAAMGAGLVVAEATPSNAGEAARTVSQVRLFHEKAREIAEGITRLGLPADPPATAAELALRLLGLISAPEDSTQGPRQDKTH